MSIKSIESLREHLQWAIEIEHATIPPYMCALYSIKRGHNAEPAEILKSVLMEEMLHICLVANVLNAIGGHPKLAYPGFIAAYPTCLPYSDQSFQVGLEKFSASQVEHSFIRIERPAAFDSPAEDQRYETLGQFYHAIETGLKDLVEALGEAAVFSGDPGLQIDTGGARYDGSGQVIVVSDLSSALAALTEVIKQGEGLDHRSIWDGDHNMFHPERGEVSHYFRFQEILAGRRFQIGDSARSGPSGAVFEVDWDAVYNMRSNPSRDDYQPGSPAYLKMTEFSLAYSDMLRLLEQAFNGSPERLVKAIGVMFALGELAVELMRMPSGQADTSVGLWFRYLSDEGVAKGGADPAVRIVISENGPYVVYGGLPLSRKRRIASDQDESLAWRKVGSVDTGGGVYRLCRCGQSRNKPFCDGSHQRVGFDGSETAADNRMVDREEVLEGDGIKVRCDGSLCMHARFCFNRFHDIKRMLPESADVRMRTQMSGMIERCPSGAYSYSLDADGTWEEVEPDLPQEIAVLDELDIAGPLWATGYIPIERSGGKMLETRNRVTLCRCGQSKNKPFCDGTHHEIDFQE